MRWLTRDSAVRVRASIGFVVDSREIALWSRGAGTVRLEIWLEISTSNPSVQSEVMLDHSRLAHATPALKVSTFRFEALASYVLCSFKVHAAPSSHLHLGILCSVTSFSRA